MHNFSDLNSTKPANILTSITPDFIAKLSSSKIKEKKKTLEYLENLTSLSNLDEGNYLHVVLTLKKVSIFVINCFTLTMMTLKNY